MLPNLKEWRGNTHHCSRPIYLKVSLLPVEGWSLLWDISGPIVEHYQDCMGVWYCDKLKEEF
jgi:hypothetical protein